MGTDEWFVERASEPGAASSDRFYASCETTATPKTGLYEPPSKTHPRRMLKQVPAYAVGETVNAWMAEQNLQPLWRFRPVPSA